MGVQGPPWKVSKESNDIRHVGYQFYSFFSTENESRVDTYPIFQIRLPQGGPWSPWVQGLPQWDGGSPSPMNLMTSVIIVALTCCKTALPWIPCRMIQLMTLMEPRHRFYPCLATAEGGNLQSNNNRCQS